MARAEALPERMAPDVRGRSSGPPARQTWRRLAERGVWVNGCADGLGDDEHPPVDVLAGRSVKWVRLTHDRARRRRMRCRRITSTRHCPMICRRTIAFFWTSGELFKRAIERWPAIRDAWHASGPGSHARHDTHGVGRLRSDRRVARPRILGERHMSVSTPTATAARWSALRLRQTTHLRDLCAETRSPPPTWFNRSSSSKACGSEAIPGLDDNYRFRHRCRDRRDRRRRRGGRPSFPALSPCRRSRRRSAYGAFAARVVEAIKRRYGEEIHLWVDICLCSSTEDGHCAISRPDRRIDLDATLAALASMTTARGRRRSGWHQPQRHDGRPHGAAAQCARRRRTSVACRSSVTAPSSRRRFYGPFRSAAGSAPRSRQAASTIRSTCDRGPMRSGRACGARTKARIC